ncbi:MAG: molybdopterin adenylyltransferase [Rhizobiaceae bacterium]|nr:molybdopterin adenylyltransferase [Rhizobiaceae bacterium]
MPETSKRPASSRVSPVSGYGGGPAVEAWLRRAVLSPFEVMRRTIPDGLEPVRDAIIDLADRQRADLILTTGGTGPSARDLTPEGTGAATDKQLPGFGELMRRSSLEQVPTAILSRQTAGIRARTLVVNLPGRPSSIDVCLAAVFPAIPYCLELIDAARIDVDPAIVASYRPG